MDVSTHGLAFLVAFLPLYLAACGDSTDDRPSVSETSYTLSCPESSSSCGPLVEDTCLRPDGASTGERELAGMDGAIACNGDAVAVDCESHTNDHFTHPTTRIVATVSVGEKFALTVQISDEIPPTGSNEVNCEVTVIEDGITYGIGQSRHCDFPFRVDGSENNCVISNMDRDEEDANLSFDLSCESLRGTNGRSFNLDAQLRFPQCRVRFEEPNPSNTG